MTDGYFLNDSIHSLIIVTIDVPDITDLLIIATLMVHIVIDVTDLPILKILLIN